MGETNCLSFIGGAWSEAQLMRQKIWTHANALKALSSTSPI